MPSQLVDVVTEHLPDHMPELHLPELPDLPVNLDDVTERLRYLGETAGASAKRAASTTAQRAASTTRQAGGRRFTLPIILMALVGVGLGTFFLLRSRRSTKDVGSASPSDAYART